MLFFYGQNMLEHAPYKMFPVLLHQIGWHVQTVAAAPLDAALLDPRRFLFIVEQIDKAVLAVFSSVINI